jgi:hypothetical protein
MMTIEQIRQELAGATYAQSAERVEFIAARAEATGYCPFTEAGRQYIVTAYKFRPGYEIVDITDAAG